MTTRIRSQDILDGTVRSIDLSYSLAEFGIPGGTTFAYTYDDSSTTNADPGTGKFRFNNADPMSATQLYIDNLDADGESVVAWLATFLLTGNPQDSLLSFYDLTDAAVYLLVQMTGFTDGGGYAIIDITPLSSSAVSGGGGGATLLDDFNRADSSDLGANWVQVPSIDLDNWRILSNTATANVGGGDCLNAWTSDTFGGDFIVGFTLKNLDLSASGHLWLLAQMPDPAMVSFTGYLGRLWEPGGPGTAAEVKVFRGNAGSFTDIGDLTMGGVAVATNDVITLEKVGADISVTKNGVVQDTLTDASPLSASGTYIGIGAAGTNSASVDDFVGGDAAVATFPTTSVIDDFNRGDGPIGANYDHVFSFTTDPRVVSNECGASADSGGTFSDGLWNVSTFGPDSEVYIDVPTRGAGILDLWCRLTGSIDTYSGYFVQSIAPDTFNLGRYDAGSGTTLSALTQAISDGDSFGLSAIGDQITAWYKPAAGSWTALDTVTDATYNAAGAVALFIEGDGAPRYDNFGGGTYITPPAGGTLPTTAGGVAVSFSQVRANIVDGGSP